MASNQSAEITDILCTRCGLCCNGTLFADVELASEDEAVGLEILGLDVEADGEDPATLQLPCAALANRRCTIYVHRPECCRTFECKLLADVRRGAVTIEDAAAHIRATIALTQRVESLLGPLRGRRLPLKERFQEARGGRSPSGKDVDALHRAYAELERMIARIFLWPANRA